MDYNEDGDGFAVEESSSPNNNNQILLKAASKAESVFGA
jgi:hypothetical protein